MVVLLVNPLGLGPVNVTYTVTGAAVGANIVYEDSDGRKTELADLPLHTGGNPDGQEVVLSHSQGAYISATNADGSSGLVSCTIRMGFTVISNTGAGSVTCTGAP